MTCSRKQRSAASGHVSRSRSGAPACSGACTATSSIRPWATRNTPAVSSAGAISDLDNPAYAHGARWGTTRRLWGFFAATIRESLSRHDMEAELFASLPAQFGAWDGLSRDQYLEAKTLLSCYLLSSQGDRVAMANSVEGRVPFLDHELIEFVNALPAKYKLRGLEEKAVLRAALADGLPAEIVQPHQTTLPRAGQFEFLRGRTASVLRRGTARARVAETRRLLRPRCGAEAGGKMPAGTRHRLRRQHGFRRHRFYHARAPHVRGRARPEFRHRSGAGSECENGINSMTTCVYQCP